MQKIVSIDYETYLISDDMPIPKPVCLSYQIGDGTGLLIGDDMEKFLKKWLEDEAFIIAHNATFELLVTYKYFPDLRDLLINALEKGNIFCTQLYQQLLDNVSKKACFDMSLAGLVNLYLKLDISEDKKNPSAWRLRYSELDGVPLDQWPKEAKDYAIDDSKYAMRVYKDQLKIRKDLQYKDHIQASFCLNWFASRGLNVHKERVQVLGDEIDAFLNPIYAELEELGFMNRKIVKRTGKETISKNINRLKQYINENYNKTFKTDKGSTKVAKEQLELYLGEKDDDIVRKFVAISQYEKAKTAFVARLKAVKQFVRTGYNAIVRSGRTSSRASSAYPSVNIQQQPRGLKNVTWDIRNCYIPREGFKFASIDYNNLELLSTAHVLYKHYGRSNMRDIINSGLEPTDLHTVFACELMSRDVKRKVTYDEFLANKKKEGYKEYRSKGKPVTLGVPGGMGYDTIRGQFAKEGIHLGYEVMQRCQYEVVARRLLKQFSSEFPNLRVQRTGKREWSLVFDEIVGLKKILFKLYPELEEFLKTGHQKFVNGEVGWVKNDFGEWEEDPYYKYKTFGVERDFCTYTAFCNGLLMQGTSAVGAKKACWNSFLEFRDSDEVFPIAFIHDEIIYEIKDNENLEKNVDRCAAIMIDSMKSVLSSVRVAVEAEVQDYWSKETNLWAKNYWKDYNSDELKSK